MERLNAGIYDLAKYYDLAFSSQSRAEFRSLYRCMNRYAQRKIRRVYEPACGTGRLLLPFAQHGLKVFGVDLNAQAVAYCNQRLVRNGYPASAIVGDIAECRPPATVDAAFILLNTFRELSTESRALSHLHQMSACIATGGIYIIGIRLWNPRGKNPTFDRWHARRGRLLVRTHIRTTHLQLRNRVETLRVTFNVDTPSHRARAQSDIRYRTYSLSQIQSLIRKERSFAISEIIDAEFDLDPPTKIKDTTQDVAIVLRRR